MKKKIFKSDFLRSKINDYLTHLQRTPVKTVIVFTQYICKTITHIIHKTNFYYSKS